MSENLPDQTPSLIAGYVPGLMATGEDRAHDNDVENKRTIEEIESDHRALTKAAGRLVNSAEVEIAVSKTAVANSREAVRQSRELVKEMEKAAQRMGFVAQTRKR